MGWRKDGVGTTSTPQRHQHHDHRQHHAKTSSTSNIGQAPVLSDRTWRNSTTAHRTPISPQLCQSLRKRSLHQSPTALKTRPHSGTNPEMRDALCGCAVRKAESVWCNGDQWRMAWWVVLGSRAPWRSGGSQCAKSWCQPCRTDRGVVGHRCGGGGSCYRG